MCGIVARINGAGVFQKETLRHRGPDEISNFDFNSLQVEYSRLTITGGSSGSAPVNSENKRWVCFLNGEVYNFKSLRTRHGLVYSNSDTKIVIEGVAKFGVAFLKELRGMFAGLILDKYSNKVFLFRDALGEKPLFINSDNNMITISSEFDSMMKILGRPITLNSTAVISYFRFGYAEEPETFDLHVKSIPRGSVYSIDLSDGSLKREFSLEGYNLDEMGATLPELLNLIYEETLYTEVPSALALSGGIDSSSLFVAKAKRDSTGFNPIILDIPNSPNLSEAHSAKSTCLALGFDPIIAYVNNDNILHDLQVLANANDQPHADPSGLSYLKIFEAANAYGKKVFISRRFSNRPLPNELLLEEMARSKNFEVVYLESMSFADEIQLFMNAEVIVGATGGGLSNIVWINEKKCRKVVEIYDTNFDHQGASQLARRINVPYHRVLYTSALDREDIWD